MVQSNESTYMFIDFSIIFLGACFVDDAAHSFESIIKIVLWPHGSCVTCKTTNCSKCVVSLDATSASKYSRNGVYAFLLAYFAFADFCC